MSLRRGDALIVLGLIAFLAVVSLTAPRWARLLLSPSEDADEVAPPAVAATPAAPPEAEKRIGVRLYFESSEIPALVAEDRTVPFSTDLARQVRLLVEELTRGSESGHLPPLPPETRVLAVFLVERDLACVDLSNEAASGHPGGALGERLSVYAIVNSITANLPAVRRVQILIDDKPAETFAGHVDLSRPLWPDMTLVATTPPPDAETAASPGQAVPLTKPAPAGHP
jgi:hypothetical protein